MKSNAFVPGKIEEPRFSFQHATIYWDTGCANFEGTFCWLKCNVVLSCGGIGQLNCDNTSQQHVEATYRSFDFIVPPEKHSTENDVIAGKL